MDLNNQTLVALNAALCLQLVGLVINDLLQFLNNRHVFTFPFSAPNTSSSL